jgi:uncharacterized membrane protein
MIRVFKTHPRLATSVFVGSILVSGAVTFLALMLINPYGAH